MKILSFFHLLMGVEMLVTSPLTDNVINIVWLAPLNTVDDGVWSSFNASTSMAGLALAIDRVRREEIMRGMKFNVIWLDSACYAKTTIGILTSAVKDLNNLPDVIVGPPCTTGGLLYDHHGDQEDLIVSIAMQPVADLASYLNIPLFGWMSSDYRLDNKTRESTLVRVMPPLSDLGKLLIYTCGRFNWKRVAMISTKGPLTSAVSDIFKELLKEDSDFFLARHFSNVNRTSDDSDIIRRLSRISEMARIIFLVVPEREVRRYLLHAHELGMTSGEYQFLYLRALISDNDQMDKMHSKDYWRRDDGRDEEAKLAYQSLLILTYSFILRWNIDYKEAKLITRNMFANYSNAMPEFAEPDRYSRFLHDAFYLFCLAYNHTVSRNVTTTGENIFKAVSRFRFNGMTGDVQMNANADRLPYFLLWDMGPDLTFRVVTQIKYDVSPNGSIYVNFTEKADIYWGNDRSWWSGYVPPDIPVCGFSNEKCRSDKSMEVILPTVLSMSAIISIVAFAFVYSKWWKKEQNLNRKHWRVEWSEISFIVPGAPRSQGIAGSQDSSSSLNSFDSKKKDKLRKLKGKPKTKKSNKDKDAAKGTKDKTTGADAGKGVDKDVASGSANLSANQSSSMNPSSAPSYTESQHQFCRTAYIRGNMVSLRMIRKKTIKLDRRILEDMQQLNTLRHGNLALFYGACVDPPNACVLWEYCAKGSVRDIIQNNDMRLDSMFQFSLAMDITAGLHFIHSSEIKLHGNLRSCNCLVDNRWTCKLSGFGLRNLLRGEQPLDTQDDYTRYTKLFWMAPENLRRVLRGDRRQYTQSADIYSVAVVLKEILCKNTAYEEEIHMLNMTPRDVVMRVAQADGECYFRPMIGDLPGEYQTVMMSFVRLIQNCWAEDSAMRPTARRVLRLMKRLNPFQTTGIMDNMLKMMEKYSARLEDVVADRTSQLAEEKRKTDSLLYRMLPQTVADDLKSGKHVQAELFPSVTVYFSDIVGFTLIASESTPMQIIELLNLLYTVFDNAIQDFDVYKVETIGDAYMVVSGLPVGNGLRHATIMADMSLSLLRGVLNFTIPHQPGRQLRVRIGLNTGPVVAGVVGNTMPRYCLFGDTVNLASRMESHGLPLKIQMSHYTYTCIEDTSRYAITERGEIEVKGKGLMKTYWLEGKVDMDDGPIDVRVRKRNPSTINLHNFSMEDCQDTGHTPVCSAEPSEKPGGKAGHVATTSRKQQWVKPSAHSPALPATPEKATAEEKPAEEKPAKQKTSSTVREEEEERSHLHHHIETAQRPQGVHGARVYPSPPNMENPSDLY